LQHASPPRHSRSASTRGNVFSKKSLKREREQSQQEDEGQQQFSRKAQTNDSTEQEEKRHQDEIGVA